MSETFHDCLCIKDTPMAILVQDDQGHQAWVPQSQVHNDSEVFCDGDAGDLIVNSWFAEKIEWNENEG